MKIKIAHALIFKRFSNRLDFITIVKKKHRKITKQFYHCNVVTSFYKCLLKKMKIKIKVKDIDDGREDYA